MAACANSAKASASAGDRAAFGAAQHDRTHAVVTLQLQQAGGQRMGEWDVERVLRARTVQRDERDTRVSLDQQNRRVGHAAAFAVPASEIVGTRYDERQMRMLDSEKK